MAETAYDTVTNIQGGIREHLIGAASGVTWMILAVFVPMVVVSCALLVLQLYTRRSQSLGAVDGTASQSDPARLRRAF